MTQLVRKIIGNQGNIEKIMDEKHSNQTFEEYIHQRVSVYLNNPRDYLCNKFNIKSNSKQLNELLVSKMLGLKGKISKSEEFQKANIITKTIRVEKSGRIKESMSFPYFKYKEIVNESWDTSRMRSYFETTKFMFIVFVNDGVDYVFKKIMFWNMPLNILDNEFKSVWTKTKNLIQQGKIVKRIENNVNYTYFPGSSENPVAHVRPHGRNKMDVAELPVEDKLTKLESYEKHCFWLNSKYIHKIIGEVN